MSQYNIKVIKCRIQVKDILTFYHFLYSSYHYKGCAFWLFQVVVGNKSDLDADRQVSTKEGRSIADEFGLPFIETSAKTGENVAAAFETLIRSIPRTNIEYKVCQIYFLSEKKILTLYSTLIIITKHYTK